jgi:hypothetical protein
LTAKVAGIAAVARRVGTSSDTLSIRGPEDLAAASQTAPTVTVVTVTVVTKADIETDGYPVSVLPIKVLGWNRQRLQPLIRRRSLRSTGCRSRAVAVAVVC